MSRTALGPALVASLGLTAKNNFGTQVLVCTDGLANVGLGNMEERKPYEFEPFYKQIIEVAKNQNTSISILTISGAGNDK